MNNNKKSYTIIKKINLKIVNKVILPPELKEETSEVDFEKCTQKLLGDSIAKFSKFMIENYPKEYLVNFYRNINSLIVNKKSLKLYNLLLGEEFIATFSSRKNKITISNDMYKSAIYHELFHLSSSSVKNGDVFCGFSQKSIRKIVSIGSGLNEGYTQLLTERYFEDGLKGSYSCFVFIADKLEKIIGEDKMSNFYFNSNLPGLINELKQYKSEKEIMQFICGLDLLYICRNKNKYKLARDIIDDSIKETGEFLMDTYTKKLKNELNNGRITKDEFIEKVAEYDYSISEITEWACGEKIELELKDDSVSPEEICEHLNRDNNQQIKDLIEDNDRIKKSIFQIDEDMDKIQIVRRVLSTNNNN